MHFKALLMDECLKILLNFHYFLTVFKAHLTAVHAVVDIE